MPTRIIEKAFPGKKAEELYVAVEGVLRKLGQEFGIQCQYDPARRSIVVPEKMGVKGLCTVEDGRVKVALEHGLLGAAVVGTVKSHIEEKLDRLFA